MNRISRDLLRVSRKAQTYLGSIVKKYDITIAEQPFFMAIRGRDGLTQEELTALVGVDKAMTTRVLHSLEGKGLIRKVQDENDKRQNRIYKTDKVDKLGERVWADLLQFDKAVTEGISKEELESFLKTLAILEHNISRQLERGGGSADEPDRN